MSKIKVNIDRNAMRELLRSPKMMEICRAEADRALMKLGEGYKVTVHPGKERCNASVKAVSERAIKENQENNSILKAVCGS